MMVNRALALKYCPRTPEKKIAPRMSYPGGYEEAA